MNIPSCEHSPARPRRLDQKPFHRYLASGLLPLIALMVSLFLATGCTNRQSLMGVENLWRNNPAPTFKTDQMTQSDVMDLLGPPSQVIALNDQTLFYYLREKQQLNSYTLLIYNKSREQITYDRAIFFFDRRGVLKDYSLSKEAIPQE